MRWGVNQGRGARPPGEQGATRLGAIGLQLDGQARPLRDVAVCITGPEVRITALAFSSIRLNYGDWIALALHFDETVPHTGLTPRGWSARLAPCAIWEQEDGLLV